MQVQLGTVYFWNFTAVNILFSHQYCETYDFLVLRTEIALLCYIFILLSKPLTNNTKFNLMNLIL